MEPARIATESLSSSDINLLIGEGILKFLITESQNINNSLHSTLSSNFVNALEFNLATRRNALMISLIMYLNNHESLKTDHPLKLKKKSAVVKFGIEMAKRLFENDVGNTSNNQIDSFNSTDAASSSCSLQDRLQKSINSVSNQNTTTTIEVLDNYKKEFDSYDRHHFRGPILNKLYDAVCSVQPTSTQSERNFSMAAGVATKKRSKLSPEKLNAICFLKSYFKAQNKR